MIARLQQNSGSTPPPAHGQPAKRDQLLGTDNERQAIKKPTMMVGYILQVTTVIANQGQPASLAASLATRAPSRVPVLRSPGVGLYSGPKLT